VETSIFGDTLRLGITLIMIVLNGFFVACEFALVKLNRSKIEILIGENKPFSKISLWLYERQNLALSACQLGITMASLALGWIGEPAVAHLITPLINKFGINSEVVIHGIAFTIAFTLITSLHIVIGEQVPKIYAIRKPTFVILWSSAILKGFYILLYPFMYVLNKITEVILNWIGVTNVDEHDTPLSEGEIKASLSLAHASGELSKNEHRLLNAVFKFDDEVVRHIMIPRGEVEYLDAQNSFSRNLQFLKNSNHTRFPLCQDSLDKVLGVVHIKDIVGFDEEDNVDLATITRPPLLIPENMRISQLLQEFKSNRQHFAFVQDEYGTILGIVTMENVLEEQVGSMQDEFDNEEPEIIEEKSNEFLVDGDIQIDKVNEIFKCRLTAEDADTLSGLMVEKAGYKIKPGDNIALGPHIRAEVIEMEGIRASKVKLIIEPELTEEAKINS